MRGCWVGYINCMDNPMRARTVRQLIDIFQDLDRQGYGNMPVEFATTFHDSDEGLCRVRDVVLDAVKTSSFVTLISADDGLSDVCDPVDRPIIAAAQENLTLKAEAYYMKRES